LLDTHQQATLLFAGVFLVCLNQSPIASAFRLVINQTETMAEVTDRDHSGFSAPQYQISYGDDHTLQWTPPVGSKALAVALSYHFPLQKDLESKMQAAMRAFLHQERQSPPRETEQVKSSCVDQSTVHQQPSSMMTESSITPGLEIRPGVASTLQIMTWDSEIKEFNPKIKRRRYEKDEREKIAANRGFACERHRRQKMKVCVPLLKVSNSY
jgi:hypothetical protein